MTAISRHHRFLIGIWAIAFIVIGVFGVFMWRQSSSKDEAPQTTTVTKTTLQQIVSASGQVTSSSQVSVTTNAGGKVKKRYASVGSSVKKGDKILEIEADATTIQNQKDAWAAYLTAKNNLNQAKAKLYTLAAAKAAAEQKFNQEAVDKGLGTTDPQYIQLQNTLLAAQAEYNNQQSVIDQATAAADNAYLAYQQTSATVTAPTDGVIQDVAYEEGDYITAASGATGSTGGSSVATLKTSSRLTAKLNVSELDITGVTVGQEVILTLTALEDKTFHGKILSVASSGDTESNVTTFPVIIEITDASPDIRVGMAISGDITVQIKENVLALPNQAITSVGDTHTVKILSNGQERTVDISVGLVLDTQSEITAGLNEGDIVVVPSTSSTTSSDDESVEPRMPGGIIR